MNRKDIKVNMTCKVLDEEQNRWCNTKVIEVSDDIILKDIDPNSSYQNMEFPLLEGDENDINYIKWDNMEIHVIVVPDKGAVAALLDRAKAEERLKEIQYNIECQGSRNIAYIKTLNVE